MAIREAIQVGDSRLKAHNKVVADFSDPIIKQIVTDLIDSMRSKELLIGLSAPQIGENYKIFVTEPRKTKFRTGDQIDALRVYINPKIISCSSEETIIYEGCGSFISGQLFGPVKRSKEITIEASDLEGKRFQLTCDGILARVIQHEYDHLDGIEFIEKVFDYKKLMNVDFYLKDIKMSKEQDEASVIIKKDVIFLT
jgi:peptide deformylase